MKSYIINNKRMTDSHKGFSKAFQNDQWDMENYLYRNMITDDTNNILSLNSTIDSNFPSSNILLESNTKEVRVPTATYSGSINTAGFFLTADKNDDEGYNSAVFKFNKLDDEMMEILRRGTFIITFTDTGEVGQPSHSSPLTDVVISLNKTYDYDDSPSSGDLEASWIDLKNGVIYISPEMIATIQPNNRSAAYDGKLYHRYIKIECRCQDTFMDSYFALSNVSVSNALEVEFENDPAFKEKDLTRIKENNQGIEFKDIYNSKKEATFTLPLLTQLEFRELDRSFFRFSKTESFYIFPLSTADSDEVEVYENYLYGGHYNFDSDYSPSREFNDIYEVKFKVKEVI